MSRSKDGESKNDEDEEGKETKETRQGVGKKEKNVGQLFILLQFLPRHALKKAPFLYHLLTRRAASISASPCRARVTSSTDKIGR